MPAPTSPVSAPCAASKWPARDRHAPYKRDVINRKFTIPMSRAPWSEAVNILHELEERDPATRVHLQQTIIRAASLRRDLKL